MNVAGAGGGTLEVTISNSSTTVPHTVKPAGDGMHTVTFMPQIAEPHTAIVKFNGDMVTGLHTPSAVTNGHRTLMVVTHSQETCARNVHKFLAQVSCIKLSCKFMQVRLTTHQIKTGVLGRNK